METSNEDFKVQYCNTPQCKICRLNLLDTNPYYNSNLASKNYKINGNGSCNSQNCIYLISCKQEDCHQCYVGFTTTKLNTRLAGHRANIINKTEGKIIMDHFTKLHSVQDMRIKPIEFCDKGIIRNKEKYWMQELNTIFPYGLNNRIDVNGIKDAFDHVKNNKDTSIYTLFNEVKNNRTKKGSGQKNGNPDVGSINNFKEEDFIELITQNVEKSIANNCRKLIMGLKIKHIKTLFLHLNTIIAQGHGQFRYNEHLLYMIKDICLYRLTKSSKKRKPFNKYLIIEYVNRLMDKINLNKLIHSKNSYERFPVSKDHLENTGITFKYSKPIRNKITNYNHIVNNPKWDINCVCDKYSDFIDENHGHVLTGNLDIIQDIPTKIILKQGLNYRLKQPINREKALSTFKKSISAFIDDLSASTKTPIELFNTWKEYVTEGISMQLNQYPEQDNCKAENLNLKFIREFQKTFVITPVDKAPKNIGIICKKYYLEILKNEINSNNFLTSVENIGTILADYSSLLQSKFNHPLDNVRNKLPFMYWIPKFHKVPIDTRFITSGRNTVINVLSKYIGICLKHLIQIERNQCNLTYKYNNIKNFYIIEDNKEIVEYMNNSNIFIEDNIFVKTFDFKTLYTDIPHNELKDNIKIFINSIFEAKRKQYINISQKAASFSDKASKTGSFTKEELIKLINFLIDNSFIYFNDSIEKLVNGIPTGTNCASDVANIFLHIYEKKHIETLVENNNSNYLSYLGDIFRYQDDLINFNTKNINDNFITDIYPKKMTIKNTNITRTKVAYLDLSIEVINNKYYYKLYDKRKDFNFPITNFPNLKGNIPINPAYGVFTSQLIRYSRINLQGKDFIEDCRNLVSKLKDLFFNKNKLLHKYNMFCKNYIHIWAHFGIDLKDSKIIETIFQ